MREDTKISIIVPVYNVEPYIRQCLDSIINQTYRNLEIIVIDDGSPDHCGEICDEYAAKDNRIIVIHKENGGVNVARNIGIQRATGEWIAFVDSDDWCELDYFEQFIKEYKQILRLNEGNIPNVLLSKGRLIEYSKKQQIQTWHTASFHYTDRKHIELLMANIQAYGLPWDKLYNTCFLKENQLQFNVSCKALDDFLFNFQVLDHASDVVGCTCIGYHNRVVTTTSITGGYSPNKFQVTYHTICTLYNYIQQHNITGEAANAVEKVALAAILHSFNCYYFHPANSKPYSQVAREIREMKTSPHIHKAIYSKNNRYLSFRQIVMKYAMRLPWIYPVKILYIAKEAVKQK